MPAFVTPSQLRQALAVDAAKKPDIVKGTYVAPDGARGKHIVKLSCSDREVAVSGQPKQTFNPGTSVLLASHQNGQHRTMLSYPVGARGASQYQAAMQRRQATILPGYGNTCPVQITGHDYLGVIFDNSVDPPRLRMRQYRDGVAGSWAGGAWTDWPPGLSEPTYAGPAPGFAAILGSTVAIRPATSSVGLVLWNYVDATIDYVTGSGGVDLVSGPVAAGGYFWAIFGGSPAQLYRVDPDTLAIDAISQDTVLGPLWASSASQIYSLASGTQFLARSFGGDDTEAWTTIGSSPIEFTGQDNGGAIGSDGLLIQSYAGTIRTIRPTVAPAGTSTVTPAHWTMPPSIWATPGGAGIVCMDPSTPAALTRISSSRDYSGVSAECAMPSTPIDNDPDTDTAPIAFFPSN